MQYLFERSEIVAILSCFEASILCLSCNIKQVITSCQMNEAQKMIYVNLTLFKADVEEDTI
jgi:hypothetical protein